MSGDVQGQSEAVTTVSPGRLLRAGRLEAGLTEREVEDLLNLMPGYVSLLERDEFQALRSPAFARGYVRAYARLLNMDQAHLLRIFDELPGAVAVPTRRVERRPPQLQRTGLGVAVGILLLLVLVLALWWWQGRGEPGSVTGSDRAELNPGFAGLAAHTGER